MHWRPGGGITFDLTGNDNDGAVNEAVFVPSGAPLPVGLVLFDAEISGEQASSFPEMADSIGNKQFRV